MFPAKFQANVLNKQQKHALRQNNTNNQTKSMEKNDSGHTNVQSKAKTHNGTKRNANAKVFKLKHATLHSFLRKKYTNKNESKK